MSDPFSQPTGGGKYPSLDDLEGCLVLLRPSKVETVPGYQGKGTVERITADTWVFGPNVFTDPAKPDLEAIEHFSDMYFSQAGMVPSLKQALKPDGSPYVLGVVAKFPSKKLRESGVDTTEKVNQAYTAWLRAGGKGEKPQFAWGMAPYEKAEDGQPPTSHEVAARALIERNRPADPFAAAE